MRCLPVLLLGLALLAAPVAAQCAATVSVPDGDPTTGICNVIPFGQSSTWSAGYTTANVIPASFMPSPNQNPYVVDVAFAPCELSSTGITGSWSCSTVIIGIGHIPNPLPSTLNFPTVDTNTGILNGIGSFLDLTLLHNSYGTVNPLHDTQYTTSGTFSWNTTQDTWSPLGYAAAGGTGFAWNGVDNIAWFITFQNSVVPVTGWTGGCHRDAQPRYSASGYNGASASTSSSGLKIQLLVSPGPGLSAVPVWQCNQPTSSADVNGATDPGLGSPMVTTVGAGTTVAVNFGGLMGQPFDLAITSPEPGLPVGGGGFLTGSGYQAVNIDLFAPSLAFLFNGTFTNTFTPYSVFASAPVPVSFAFQQAVIDPGNADGLALSHLNELNWIGCGVSENWDSLPTGLGVTPIGWTNPAAGATAWTVQTGGTSSSSTGPTSAFNGPNYAYCETSSPNFPNVPFVMDTCAVDVTTLMTGILSFELSAIGSTVGTLNVYQGDGSGTFAVTPIYTHTGAEPGQAQGGTEWTNKSITLSLGSPFINFRFEYISGTSFYGDLALDDILLN